MPALAITIWLLVGHLVIGSPTAPILPVALPASEPTAAEREALIAALTTLPALESPYPARERCTQPLQHVGTFCRGLGNGMRSYYVSCRDGLDAPKRLPSRSIRWEKKPGSCPRGYLCIPHRQREPGPWRRGTEPMPLIDCIRKRADEYEETAAVADIQRGKKRQREEDSDVEEIDGGASTSAVRVRPLPPYIDFLGVGPVQDAPRPTTDDAADLRLALGPHTVDTRLRLGTRPGASRPRTTSDWLGWLSGPSSQSQR